MPELTADDVARYTSDRVDSDEATRLLSLGLSAARRFCGWHVCGVRENDVVSMDGTGSRLLVLPTLALDELASIVDDGVTFTPGDLYVSARGLVQKRSGACWSRHYGAVTVTMTHGFAEAEDFNAAVLSFIDRSSLAPTGGRARVIGPFQYPDEAMATGSAFSVVERSLLEPYRLESAP